MLSLVPAFVGGMPGGVELLVIFVIMLLLFGVPVALAVILGYRYLSGQSGDASKDERIEELESELETLKAQVETATSGETAGQTTSDEPAEQSTSEAGGVEDEQ